MAFKLLYTWALILQQHCQLEYNINQIPVRRIDETEQKQEAEEILKAVI